MRTVVWIGSAAAVMAGCGAPEPEPPRTLAEHPHVVLIVLDTLRADAVGSYGGPDGVSPQFDALAESGVRFARVVAPSNWTKPSWAGLLTGRHARSLGVFKEIGQCLPDDAVTLAEQFQNAGYRTYGATANPNINSSFNYHQGFDTHIDSHAVWRWMDIMDGEEEHTVADESSLTPATHLYEGAVNWASERGGESCFIQICTMEMHEYHRGPHSLNRAEFTNGFEDADFPERAYYQALKQSSHDLQAFLDDLRALPGWDDMLVIITSDHGEGLSSHPDVARSTYHGGVMYDSHLLVPLIMHRPGALPEGRVVHTPVQLIDVMPTVSEIIGLPDATNVDGVSLAPLIEGADTVEGMPSFFVSESYLRDLDKIAVTSGAWRYIENHDQRDPDNAQRGQMNAEALQPVGALQNGKSTDQIERLPEIAAELRDQLRAWEQANPKAPPSECGSPITDEEREQLEAIGYLDADDEI